MSAHIQFELVSPEKKLVSEAVYMAVMPGDEGMFGALGGHCSLVSSLKPGVVRVYRAENDAPVKYFIAGGFADVNAQTCTILAEEALRVEDLDQDSLEQYLRDLNEDLEMAEEKTYRNRVKQKIAVTKAKLAAISGY